MNGLGIRGDVLHVRAREIPGPRSHVHQIVRVVLITVAMFVGATASASARCSYETIRAYEAKVAGAETWGAREAAGAESILRDVYRDLTYCIDTAHGDNAQLWDIGLLRERIETDVALYMAVQGRFSEARSVLRTVDHRLSGFARDAKGDRATLAEIALMRARARRIDDRVHRAQGLTAMRAAGDNPLRALIPPKRGPAFLPASPKPRAAAIEPATSCARPNAPAAVIRPVEPDTPPMAQQQGISGTVEVVVSLNADGNVIGTRVQNSPSAILNNAALAAARASTFQSEVRNCKPVASDIIFSVDFAAK